jgi:phosphoribosylglycinamide formyltransferase-1
MVLIGGLILACRKINLAIFASGNGSNAQNIIEFVQDRLDMEVLVVITDNPDAYVIKRAMNLGVPIEIIPIERDLYPNYKMAKKVQEDAIILKLKECGVDWVCLAGYMRILGKELLNAFYDKKLKGCRIINVHPSLLPAFPGRTAYKDSFEYGVAVSGVTIHLVDNGVDTGPIILQKSFVREGTFEEYTKKGLEIEHELYRRVLELVSKDKVSYKKITPTRREL